MNTSTYRQKVHWRRVESLLRSEALHNWRNYEVSKVRSKNGYLVSLAEGRVKFYLYVESDWDWRISYIYSSLPFYDKETDTEHVEIQEGTTSSKRNGTRIFLFSVLAYLSAKNPASYSDVEYRLYNRLRSYFDRKDYKLLSSVSEWKANARS